MERNNHLSNKCALFHNMHKYYKAVGMDPFDVLPLTFHIKNGTDDPEYFLFLKKFNESAEKKKKKKLVIESPNFVRAVGSVCSSARS